MINNGSQFGPNKEAILCNSEKLLCNGYMSMRYDIFIIKTLEKVVQGKLLAEY